MKLLLATSLHNSAQSQKVAVSDVNSNHDKNIGKTLQAYA